MRTEAGDESAVVPLAQGVLQERGRGSLLELESAAHRAAGVDQQPHVQRKIGFSPEIQDGLRWLVIVQNRKVALIQIPHELAVLIGSDEKYVNLVHPGMNGDDGVLGLIGAFGGGCGAGTVKRRRTRDVCRLSSYLSQTQKGCRQKA